MYALEKKADFPAKEKHSGGYFLQLVGEKIQLCHQYQLMIAQGV